MLNAGQYFPIKLNRLGLQSCFKSFNFISGSFFLVQLFSFPRKNSVLSGCCGGHTCDGHLTQILLPSNVMKMRERKKERLTVLKKFARKSSVGIEREKRKKSEKGQKEGLMRV